MKITPSNSIYKKALLHDLSNRSDNYVENKIESVSKLKQLGKIKGFRSCSTDMFIMNTAIEPNEDFFPSLKELNKRKDNVLVDRNWKCAFDNKTKKRYFYNKHTREVTWSKPHSFNEWKVYMDQSTKKYYYYNILTNETTWDQPKELNVGWNLKSVENDNTKIHQNNLNRSESLPSYLLRLNYMSSPPVFNSFNATQSTHTNTGLSEQFEAPIESQWKAFFDNVSGKHVFFNMVSKEMSWTKPTGFQEWVTIRSTTTDESYFYNLLTGESTWTHPSKQKNAQSLQFDKENYDHDGTNEQIKEFPIYHSTHDKGTNETLSRELERFEEHEDVVETFLEDFESLWSYSPNNDKSPRHNPTNEEAREHCVNQLNGYEEHEDVVDTSSDDFDSPYDEQQSCKYTFCNTKADVNLTSPEPYDEHLHRWRISLIKEEEEIIDSNHCTSTDKQSSMYAKSTTPFSYQRLTKPIHLSGSSGRTILFLPR